MKLRKNGRMFCVCLLIANKSRLSGERVEAQFDRKTIPDQLSEPSLSPTSRRERELAWHEIEKWNEGKLARTKRYTKQWNHKSLDRKNDIKLTFFSFLLASIPWMLGLEFAQNFFSTWVGCVRRKLKFISPLDWSWASVIQKSLEIF